MEFPVSSISRRDFLKFGAAGIAGIFLPPMLAWDHQSSETHGRIIDDNVPAFSRPSQKADKIAAYWKDMVIPIQEVTVGDDEATHNRVWYQIDHNSYIHSGQVQPVHTMVNPVINQIPAEGALAEVTVPFTDAHWGPGKDFPVAYRFYYETTHWVTSLVYSDSNVPWYRLYDDKWKYYYHVPAMHLRIFPDEDLTPLSPHIPMGGKRIEVRTDEQVVIAYEWDRPVFMTRTATGAKFSNGDFRTPAGRHVTSHKRPFRHMAAGNLAYNGYDLPGVPWVCYITESGISFHGTYWHNNFGRPRSHGCINLTPKAAKWIFRWTLPYVPPQYQYVYEEFGTPVDVI